MNNRRSHRAIGHLAATAVGAIVVAAGMALGGPAATATSAAQAASAPKSLHVLVASGFEWSAGLDPATNPISAADAIYEDAIYGDLFLQEPNGRIVPDLATGYSETNGGKTWTVYLRHGATFSDGTPFDAEAVATNVKRDLLPQYACICLPNFPVSSITTPDSTTVVFNLTKPFAPFIAGFLDESPNWTVDPTALAKMGDNAYKLTPIGAGPFEVVTDRVNSELVLKANPHYWHAGEPHFTNLTFQTVGTDESAYSAMVDGEGQAYFSLGTLSLVPTVKKRFTLTPVSTNEPAIVQLNTTIPPFNNILAREAMYYATDTKALTKGVFGTTKYVDESLEGPGGHFYEKRVPGYKTYDLAKAKALVRQLGGLSTTYLIGNTAAAEIVPEALQAQWAKAGIKVKLEPVSITTLIKAYQSNSWTMAGAQSGGYDPALIPGLAFRFASNAPFTGVKDPTLDQLMNEGAATLNPAARAKIYDKIYAYVASHAYAPVLYAAPAAWTVTVHGLGGLGLTTTNTVAIDWGSVTLK
jgi:peptide/nickel transport system substrate-binding protein